MDDEQQKKCHGSPFLGMAQCAKLSGAVYGFEYFTCFLKSVSPVGARIVSFTRIDAGQILIMALEGRESFASVLIYAKVVILEKCSLANNTLYAAQLKFFDIHKTIECPNLIDFSKAKKSLTRYASFFRNAPWLSIKENRYLHANVSDGQ